MNAKETVLQLPVLSSSRDQSVDARLLMSRMRENENSVSDFYDVIRLALDSFMTS